MPSNSNKISKVFIEVNPHGMKRGWTAFSKNKAAQWGLYFLGALILMALFSQWIAPHDPTQTNLSFRLQGPSKLHWLGTDELGRDILSRLIYGARTTVYIVFFITFYTVPVGVLIGVVSGYFGEWLDRFLMRITDIFLSLPRLILALAFVAALGPGLDNLIFAISLTSWMSYARFTRSETLLIVQENSVKAAYRQGAGSLHILWHYVLPRCLTSVLVQVTYDMAGIILLAAGFGFLGLGVQPPTPEWGSMVTSSQLYFLDRWWVSAAPGLAIFLVSLALNFVGDGLRDVIDPRHNN